MSFLFGKKDNPQPAPVPASPQAPDNTEAEAQRKAAADAAVAERASAGRQQTIVAGMKIAADDQEKTGLLSAARRRASRELVG